MSAHILRENYVVEEYDRFHYAAVYYHQRTDVHPPLYYFLLHTIASMFPGTYSAQYALAINLAALFLIDIIMIKLCGLLYGKKEYAAVPLALLTLMEIMRFLYAWQRMYMLLFLFCLWYVYIHARLFRSGTWKKSLLLQMICCIVLGSLTHYYFYVYAALWSLGSTIWLLRSGKKYEWFRYLYAGVAGLAVSWIIYPYVMWHIFGPKKHTLIEPWTLEKGREYLRFLNDRLFNGRILTAGVIVLLLFVLRGRVPQQDADQSDRAFRRILAASGILYSVLIYTMDEGDGLLYYSTPLYVSFIIWFSMILVKLAARCRVVFWHGVKLEGAAVVLAVICVIGIYSLTTVKSYVNHAQRNVDRIVCHESLRDGIYRISEEYGGCDCIYIAEELDPLLGNLWFEFGEYDEFKWISTSDLGQGGIGEADLAGRESDDPIVIYAPIDCALNHMEECERIGGDESHSVYFLAGGENR